MIRFSFRSHFLLFVLNAILIGFTVLISPLIWRPLGIVSFASGQGDSVIYHYLDAATGFQVDSPKNLSSHHNMVSSPQVRFEDDVQHIVLTHTTDSDQYIATFPIDMRFTAVRQLDDQTILLVQRDNDTEKTILTRLDIETGISSHFVTIDEFLVGNVSFSPTYDYLILRYETSDLSIASEAQRNMLLNLQTGDLTELGQLVYAYWSPDGQKILIGHLTEQRLHVSVEVLDIHTLQIRDLAITVAHGDTTFFVEIVIVGSSALLWANDSQSVIVYNTFEERLYHLSLTGEIINSYADGLFTPQVWSPNGRYLLTTGYDAAGIGAFILDTQIGIGHRVQSDNVILESLADFAWSDNSAAIAIFTRTSGINQRWELNLYDTTGASIATPNLQVDNHSRYFMLGSLQWFEQ